MKYYTIGEIFRLKLLLNHKGEPYTAKATISKIVNQMVWRPRKSPFGIAKEVSEKEIQKHNNKW